MLSLESKTSDRWLSQVDQHLDEILIDHAHCEKKAAGTAMNLLFAYVDNIELCREMTEIVREELEHFHLVIDLLGRRGIRFRRLTPSTYGRKLNDLVRRQEPERAVDRLLVAGLIEARSCERFDLLRKHMRRELAEAEAAIIAEGDPLPRMHS
jgi:tRNA-(ms[2]io[6]A)-hydroxylase